MTRSLTPNPVPPQPTKPAFPLQGSPPMRFAFVLSLAILSIAGTALAQSSGTLPYTCTGTNAPNLEFTLAVKRSDNDYVTISPQVIENVLDLAECGCDSQDLYLQMRVISGITTMPLPHFEVWVGNSCAQSSRNTTCEQILGDDLTVSVESFATGGTGGTPRQRVPVRALISPAFLNSQTSHQCISGLTSNSMWFLFGDPSMPDYCSVRLDAYETPPPPAQNVAAGSGDEAVTLSWSAPPQGSNNLPSRYQILCADENGNPLPSQGAYAFGETPNGRHQLGYSTCIDATKHIIQRQVLSTTGSAISTTDGGTAADGGTAGTSSAPFGVESDRFSPQADPLDGGTDDGGADAGTVLAGTDAGIPADVQAVFPNLDKKFVCSDPLDSTTTRVRIGNLENKQKYSFAVVSIDKYGNPNPSSVVTAEAQPVEDLYRRFLDEGGKKQGFCFIATAAYGSYESPYVKVLRDFRDVELLPNGPGRAFVAWYYRNSPPWADWIRVHPTARALVRAALLPLIGIAWLWLRLGTALMLVLTLAGGWMGLRGWRRFRRWRRSRHEHEVEGHALASSEALSS